MMGDDRFKRAWKAMVSIAAIEVDWLQGLVSADEAMQQISDILKGEVEKIDEPSR